MSTFSSGMPPLCPGIGGVTTQIWGHAKNISGALRRSLCPQLQNRVGAWRAAPQRSMKMQLKRTNRSHFLYNTSLIHSRSIRQHKKLSYRWQTARHISAICNGAADHMKQAPTCVTIPNLIVLRRSVGYK